MSNTLRPYLNTIRSTLSAAMSVRNLPCLQVERHNRPEVEYKMDPELLLNPVLITRTENEYCLIEGSMNSLRVSIKVKQADELEQILARKFVRFITQRAEELRVLRRVAVPGYSISFLITHAHLEEMKAAKLVDFVVDFMTDIDREISELKLSVNTRGRAVAHAFLSEF
mmetsp:Transcript_2541/g.7517  ORF Transcript_2541/g.7517 Transcript_2541/m.7517 type:complete len:169 (-) Transcript_2541:59-565(-)